MVHLTCGFCGLRIEADSEGKLLKLIRDHDGSTAPAHRKKTEVTR